MKKLVSLLFAFFMLAGCVSMVHAEAEKSLNLGDYITLGKYRGKNIVWRYVADDENGKLILCDKVLNSQKYSNNAYWNQSSIRSWLNNIDEGFMDNENFTASELSLVKPTLLKTILDYPNRMHTNTGVEFSSVPFAGGGGWYSVEDIKTSINCYRNAPGEVLLERIFLLNFIQLHTINMNRDVLGDYLNYFESIEDSLTEESWWTRDPSDKIYQHMGGQLSYGNMAMLFLSGKTEGFEGHKSLQECSVRKNKGVRPAFYLNEENAQILSGSGTKDDPYVLDGKPVPERFEENGLYGYKDADGNVIVPAKYAKALPFSDGAALVATVEDPYRWRYIGTDGNYLFEKAFYASNNFNNGYALVLVKDDPKYSYIDKTGEFATELLFDDAEDFCGGYARVQIDGKWGVVDTNFNFKVPCQYNSKDEVLGKLNL